ncbi:MAG: transposase [Desulfovibrio sp.]|nr:transposase [Desulfovibrio sp.]
MIKYFFGYSPDLNPVEKMWSKLKSKIRTSRTNNSETLCFPQNKHGILLLHGFQEHSPKAGRTGADIPGQGVAAPEMRPAAASPRPNLLRLCWQSSRTAPHRRDAAAPQDRPDRSAAHAEITLPKAGLGCNAEAGGNERGVKT